MRGFVTVLVCLGAVVIGGCSGSRSGAALDDGPPTEFLETALSFGDDDSTSMCYRVQQLVVINTMQGGKHEWKKLDDSTWEYSQSFESSGEQGSSRIRFQKEGDLALVSDYEERLGNSEVTGMDGGSFRTWQWTFFQNLRTSGALFIKGCADPSYATRRYDGV